MLAVVGGSLRAVVTYSFGNVAVNDRINMQPNGVPGFNAGCFQLLGSEVLQSDLASSGVTVGTRDRLLFFANTKVNGTNNRIQMRYTFQVLCAGKS
jgi:hypothetical protein